MARVGFSFPFRLNSSKNVSQDSGIDRTKRLLVSAIFTSVGEREGDPSLGMMGTKYLFRTFNDSQKNLIRYLIKDSLTKYFPWVTLKRVEFTEEIGKDSSRIQIVNLDYIDTQLNQVDSVGIELFRL